MLDRRRLLTCCAAALAILRRETFAADHEPSAAWNALRAGGIVLFRHATAPGTGDPAGMRIGDCSTQRNLDDAGREEARRIGAAFRARAIAPALVLASRWCRCLETAELAFPGRVTSAPEFDSFFADRARSGPQTEAARVILANWKGPGALVVVTHQVNITALTGLHVASGEGVVLSVADGRLEVRGRLSP